MIDIQLHGGIDGELFRRLGVVEKADPIELARRIARILVEENERGVVTGTDADGSATAPLQESTIRRGRGGFGPPRAPRISASRVVTGFEAAVARTGDHQYIIRAGWPGLDFVRYLNDGTKHMVARPLAGIRPTTRVQIEEASRGYAEGLVRGDE